MTDAPRAILDSAHGIVTWCDKRVYLSPLQTRIARIVALRSGSVVPYVNILDAMYDDDRPEWAFEVLKSRLVGIRRRLREAGAPKCIYTAWGRGLYSVNLDLASEERPIELDIKAQRLVRRLIETCPSDLLAEQARQAVFRD